MLFFWVQSFSTLASCYFNCYLIRLRPGPTQTTRQYFFWRFCLYFIYSVDISDWSGSVPMLFDFFLISHFFLYYVKSPGFLLTFLPLTFKDQYIKMVKLSVSLSMILFKISFVSPSVLPFVHSVALLLIKNIVSSVRLSS